MVFPYQTMKQRAKRSAYIFSVYQERVRPVEVKSDGSLRRKRHTVHERSPP